MVFGGVFLREEFLPKVLKSFKRSGIIEKSANLKKGKSGESGAQNGKTA